MAPAIKLPVLPQLSMAAHSLDLTRSKAFIMEESFFLRLWVGLSSMATTSEAWQMESFGCFSKLHFLSAASISCWTPTNVNADIFGYCSKASLTPSMISRGPWSDPMTSTAMVPEVKPIIGYAVVVLLRYEVMFQLDFYFDNLFSTIHAI